MHALKVKGEGRLRWDSSPRGSVHTTAYHLNRSAYPYPSLGTDGLWPGSPTFLKLRATSKRISRTPCNAVADHQGAADRWLKTPGKDQNLDWDFRPEESSAGSGVCGTEGGHGRTLIRNQGGAVSKLFWVQSDNEALGHVTMETLYPSESAAEFN
ncbi:unnamed protein product [Pleuronectes platessa]|uniref:Uncharacterized protein n=1 Tax=Pleuronectes platessa TaxID=8262 RepID=A0A9N7YDV9_PLEPL|nr:unnamed protein product [Pleuronectes platessa]